MVSICELIAIILFLQYDEAERRREMAKNSLERYTHYYERWATNESVSACLGLFLLFFFLVGFVVLPFQTTLETRTI